MRNETHRGVARFMLPAVVFVLAGGIVAAENIDPGDDGSQYAWSENAGRLNAQPQGGGGPGVTVGDTALTGCISLSCQNKYVDRFSDPRDIDTRNPHSLARHPVRNMPIHIRGGYPELHVATRHAPSHLEEGGP